jgi:hypothetical protein
MRSCFPQSETRIPSRPPADGLRVGAAGPGAEPGVGSPCDSEPDSDGLADDSDGLEGGPGRTQQGRRRAGGRRGPGVMRPPLPGPAATRARADDSDESSAETGPSRTCAPEPAGGAVHSAPSLARMLAALNAAAAARGAS